MTAIIFGAKGQDGIYLSALLKEKGIEVTGIERNDPNLISISDFKSVCTLIKLHQPTYIFHLAANSTTRHEVWEENHQTISTGTLNILEAVKLYSPKTKIFLSGSGLQFVNNARPISELDAFNASSMYAVSRIHAAYAARYYRTLGIKAYMGYFFNHDSPYRTDRHINKKIIEVARRIANGSNEKLQIGDIQVRKEFGFAGDIVKAILMLVEQDHVFEATIGTGIAHSIEEWIAICFSRYDLDWKQHIAIQPGFIPEYNLLVSNPSTINSLGWKPETDIHLLEKKMNNL
jgi:GDPmannose 4,6-dehydratase